MLITAAAHGLETVKQPDHLIERFLRGSRHLLVVHLTDQKHLISLLLQRPPFRPFGRGSVAEPAAVEGGAGAREQRLQQVQSDEGNDGR